jgi:hypothetical protein
MTNGKKDCFFIGLAVYCFAFCLGLAVSPAALADYSDWRGVVVGGTPANEGRFYYYDVFVKIDDGNPVYLTSLPSQNGKDLGYLLQYFPRDDEFYQFQVIACDSHGYEGPPSGWSAPFASGFVAYDCSAETVPIADPGTDQVVAVGTPVPLDGSGSYDLFSCDSLNLQYYWECYAAPEAVTLSDPCAMSPTFTPSTIRYVKVDAVEDIYDFVVTNPGPAQNVPLGSTAVLDGSLSDTSSATVYYRWEALNKTVEIQNADQPVASFVPDAIGTYVFQLKVITDDDFSSKITLVSVYDEAAVGSLYTPEINGDCIDCSIADLEDDGDVDGSDLAAFAGSFNSSRGLENYRVDCDFDKNLRVDETDSAILASSIGKSDS